MQAPDLNTWLRSLHREDDCLAGPLTLTFGGQDFDVDIAFELAEGASPSAAQLATVRGWFEREADLRPQIVDRLFPEYQRTVEKYRTAFREWGEDPDANAPLINRPEELTALLVPRSLFVPANYDTGTFGLGFWSKWEQEHGVGVQFVLWHLTEIGESAIHFDFA